jgi:uncharacterized protein (TIGR03086 family)
MDELELHGRALDIAALVVAGVKPGHMVSATPCPEWDVRAVMNHMVGGNRMFAAFALGQEAQPRVPGVDLVGDDPAGVYTTTAVDACKAWRSDGALERMMTLPIGTLPGNVVVGMHGFDHYVHAFDIASATGQLETLDDELSTIYLERAKGIPASFRGPGKPFDVELMAPDGASIHERMAAATGRKI